MGVVTGIVQEFHFGMNWAEYSRFMGDIFGAPLALEALMAFFLESTFMGVWIFGWDRLNKTVHAHCSYVGGIRYKPIRILDSRSKLLHATSCRLCNP